METLFGLLGGLALFLFGMNMMSEGLQKAAGSKMKKILGMLTANRIFGVIAGALVTAVLQSSSATTVMVIGFVGAGLMTLPQGISVIFGANIGTTMTAQLLAFKISDYIMPIVFIGFIIWFLFKNEKIKYAGQTIFAFGLLFVGIETMGDVMKPLASSDVFLNMIEYVTNIPALGVCVGALMTCVVQSSSATIAVLQNFASQAGADGVTSVIGLKGAIPILLGDNIGTTITALLACIGQSREAKRVAVSHATFNIIGSLIFIWLVPVLAYVAHGLTVGFSSATSMDNVDIISREIANAHTTYNTLNTLLWLPLLPVMVKIVCFIVPDRDGTMGKKLVQLDTRIVNQPAFALQMLREQVVKYCERVGELIDELQEAVAGRDEKACQRLAEQTSRVQSAEEELDEFTVAMLAEGTITEAQAAEAADLIVVTESVGRINERIGEAAELYASKVRGRTQFSETASEDLAESVQMLSGMYSGMLGYLESDQTEAGEALEKSRRKIIKRQSKLRKRHFNRLANKECPASNKEAYEGILLALERISNECFGLLEHEVDLRVMENAELQAAQEAAEAEK